MLFTILASDARHIPKEFLTGRFLPFSTAADYGHGNRAGAAISGHGRMGSFTKRAVSFAKSLFYISLT